jgi:hypothetical protein
MLSPSATSRRWQPPQRQPDHDAASPALQHRTQGGESEELLGRWRRSRGRRGEIVIATKVGARPLAPGTSFTDNAEGCRPG